MEIKGIIPAMATPMHEDGSINETELRRQINRQIDVGADGVFCLGTNGENYLLSFEEKIHVMEIFVDETKGRVPVYAGTGCIGTKDTIELSLKAKEIGVDGLSIISPYFAAINQSELYNHYAAIADNVDLPIILYNMPARTGNNIHYKTVEKLHQNYSNIKGIKDSSGNFDNMLRYLEVTDHNTFSVLSGNDSLILWTLLAGGKGGITGIANIFPDLMVGIYQNWINGNLEEAKKLQNYIRPMRDCLALGNPNSIIKRAANLLGEPLGPCRKPFGEVNEEIDQKIIETFQNYYPEYYAKKQY